MPDSAILLSLAQMMSSGLLLTHLRSTLSRIRVGLVCGAGVGLVVGIGMGTSVRLRRLIDPVVAAIHPIPRLAFFPLLIVAFGVGEYKKTAVVARGAFIPMVLNTVAGIRGMNPVHLEHARNYGASRRQTFRIDQLYAIIQLYAILAVMAVGIGLSGLIRWIGTRAVPWQIEARAQ